MAETPAPATTQTYFAKSIFLSSTAWFNIGSLIVLILQTSDVLVVLPSSWTKYTAALIAVINIVIRFYTVRPVAMIAPGNTSPVSVATLTQTK